MKHELRLAGGLHDTATYLTLKMDIVLLLKG